MGILPIRPYPFDDESLPSYIFRLAHHNYFDIPLRIFQECGLTMPGFRDRIACTTKWDGIDALKKLGSMSNLPCDFLSRLTYRSLGIEGKRLVRDGIMIPENAIHSRKTKICPLCLSDSAYSRKQWELVYYTVCEKHSVSMIDNCPSCGKLVGWERRHKIHECKCGSDYRKISVSTPADSLVSLSSYISEKINEDVVVSATANKWDKDNPLFTLDLEALFNVLTFMCGQVLKQCTDKKANWNTTHGIKTNNEELQPLLVQVMHLFSNWPQNFYNFLSTYKTSSQRHTGLKSSFGYFYDALYTRYTSECYSFLREHFEHFITNSWTSGSLSMHVQRLKIEQKYLTANKSAELLGVTTNVVKNMIQRGELEGVVKKRSINNFILVSEVSVQNKLSLRQNALTYEEVIALLGVGHRAVRSLLNHGCISLYRGPQVDGFAKYLFDRESVMDLINVIEGQITTQHPSDERLITFRQLVKANPVGSMVKLIQIGIIKPYGTVASVGLDKYLFRHQDKEAALRKCREETWLTVKDVSRLIGASEEYTSQWVKEGFIKHEVINGKYRINNHSVDDFQLNFITLGEILRVTQRGSNSIIKLLASYEKLPLIESENANSKGYLFLRAEITPILSLICKQ